VAGRSAADSLPAAATGFVDVPASHWASKYIAYCVAQGYVAGYGNRRFGPNDNVTASQFAVMCLRAVGYGKLGEFEGALWETNAIVMGMREGILEGDKNFSAPATRDDTAKYAFHALTEVHMVDLSADRSNYVPQQRMVADPLNPGKFDADFVAIMNNVYPQLVGDKKVVDLGGRPSTRWIFKGNEIGVYARAPIASFTGRAGPTAEARRIAVLNAIGSGIAFKESGVAVFLNGRPDADLLGSVSVSDATEGSGLYTFDFAIYEDFAAGESRNAIAERIGNMTQDGYLVEIFVSQPNTANARIDVVTVTQTDVYKVAALNASARQVTLVAAAQMPIDKANGGTVDIKATDNENLYNVVKDLKEDAYVFLTMGYKNGQHIVASLAVPESVTGVIRSNAIMGGRVGNVSLIGGTSPYNLAFRNGAELDLSWNNTAGVANPPANGKNESILYLDKFGFVAAIEAVGVDATKFVWILENNLNIVGTDGIARPGFRGVLANGEEVYARHNMVPPLVPDLQTVYQFTIDGGVYILGNKVDGVPGAPAKTAEVETIVNISGAASEIKSSFLRLNADTQNGLANYYNNLFASDVKFIYIQYNTAGVPRFSVREGVQNVTKGTLVAPPADPGTGGVLSRAVIEKRGPNWVVTAVFINAVAPTATDPNAILYVQGRGDAGTISIGGVNYNSYRVFLPGATAGTNVYIDEGRNPAIGFYTFTTETKTDTNGTVETYNVFWHEGAGKAATVVSDVVGAPPGPAWSYNGTLATVTSMPSGSGNRVMTLTYDDGVNPPKNMDFNIEDAVFIDARTGPRIENTITIGNYESVLRSVVNGATFSGKSYDVYVSLLYDDGNGKASTVYIQEIKPK